MNTTDTPPPSYDGAISVRAEREKRDATGLPITDGGGVFEVTSGRHAAITVTIHVISYAMLFVGLIAILAGASGDEYDEPTLSAGLAWTLAGAVVLQFAMLQAAVLGLDYLRAIKVSLTGKVAP